jgi:hypothetical protein
MVENNDDEGAKYDGRKSETAQCASTFLETNFCEKTSQSDGLASKASSVSDLVWRAIGVLHLSPRVLWKSLVEF